MDGLDVNLIRSDTIEGAIATQSWFIKLNEKSNASWRVAGKLNKVVDNLKSITCICIDKNELLLRLNERYQQFPWA